MTTIALEPPRVRAESEVPGALVAASVAGALALLAILMDWRGSDLPAQLFRVELLHRYGFVLWNSQWFGGTPTLDYSVVSPVLAAVLGPVGLGAVSGVISAFLFHRIAQRAFGASARTASLWFATSTVTNLVVGRVTFGLGITMALAALLALQRAHPRTAAFFGLLCALASPVAALFLAIVAGAWGFARRTDRITAWIVAACAVTPIIAISLLFPSPGSQPYERWAFLCDIGICAIVAIVVPRRFAALRWGAAIYGVVLIATYLVASPLGGNVSRLNQYAAGPILAGVLWEHRRALVILAALPFLFWQWFPAFDTIARAGSDPSTARAYYTPLIHELETQAHGFGRVEVPATYRHWEATYVAPQFALARGWERQLDYAYDAPFYDGTLTASSYRSWLAGNAVQYVALPDAQLDPSSTVEAKLLRKDLPYLQPMWHNRHWTLWRFTGFHGLVDGGATLTAVGADSFTLWVSRPGPVTVHIHSSPHWAVDGRGCATKSPGGWVELHGLRSGTVRVTQAIRGTPCDTDT